MRFRVLHLQRFIEVVPTYYENTMKTVLLEITEGKFCFRYDINQKIVP